MKVWGWDEMLYFKCSDDLLLLGTGLAYFGGEISEALDM